MQYNGELTWTLVILAAFYAFILGYKACKWAYDLDEQDGGRQ